LTDFLEAESSDGRRVLEAELHGEKVEEWIAKARAHGAELLWLHTNADLSGQGFDRFPGYVQLRADDAPPGEPLPRLEADHYARTLDAAYRGLWGHKRVAADATAPPDAIVVGLYAGDQAIGLCTAFPDERLIDGPGVVPRAREPGAYRRLLLASCAELGPGPLTVDSWGDPPSVIEAYAQLGFDVVEQTAGWQLRLTNGESRGAPPPG
jgi:hypothetical protein